MTKVTCKQSHHSVAATSDRLSLLRERVRADFVGADRAHDIDHLERVERLAARLADLEGCDVNLVRSAALVHDYHRLKGQHGLGTTGDDGTASAGLVLESCGYSVEMVTAICVCVAYTDRYQISGDVLIPPSPEAAVVRDADNLDAMGAVGIARAFAFGAVIDEPMWRPDEPVRDRYDHGVAPSVIHHFYEKLLHLCDELTTSSGRDLGQARHAELQRFVASFEAEWLGER
jgi:uncharacterized protein